MQNYVRYVSLSSGTCDFIFEKNLILSETAERYREDGQKTCLVLAQLVRSDNTLLTVILE